MLLCNPVDDTDKFIYVFIVDRDLHTLAAKYVRRADQYRISQLSVLLLLPPLP